MLPYIDQLSTFNAIVELLFIIIALIISIIIHEVSHGYVAHMLGDPTARLAGRLTLNPVPHIDPLGSVIIPGLLVLSGAAILIGWAKPVPYNPYNLKNQRWGEVFVAAAGPAVNIVIALIFAAIIQFGVASGVNPAFVTIATYIVYINILLAIFNMIPIPPLDGSKVLSGLLPFHLQMRYQEFTGAVERMGMIGIFLFIFLLIFVFGDAFFGFIDSVVELLTGVRFGV